MRKITLFCLALIAYCWQINAQSTINITTSGGSYPGEKWVSITTAVDGGGTQVWGQGDGTQCNGSGLINEDIMIAPGTYYVNCYDQYDDGWDGTLISVTAYGMVIGDNGGTSPNDGADDDASFTCEGTAEELEASFMIVVPAPPSCAPPISLMSAPTAVDQATITWAAGGSETNWTYEYGVSPYAQGGGGTSGTVMTTPSLALMGLTEGETYDIYIQSNCGGDDSTYSSLAWTQPSLGQTCSLPITLTVETDCSTATPTTLDYSAAFDLGTTDLSCDTFGTNTGSWYQFVAPATGSVFVNLQGDTAEYAVYNGCGMEVVCVNTPTNQGEVSGLTAGATYQLAVWKDGATSGTTDICIETITCPNPSTLAVGGITATTANLSWTENGSATLWDIEIVDVTGGGSVTGTPTATGVANPYTAMSLTEGNEYQFYVRADCGGSTSDWIGPFTWNQILPPANDECGTAIGLTVNADYACGSVTAGTTVAATASPQPDDATGTPDNDVWFTFVATNTDHRISLLNVTAVIGTATDMGMSVFDDAAGCSMTATNEVGESDPNTLNLSGLTPGNTYYVRVYGWSSTNTAQTNFDICVGTQPACLAPTALTVSGVTLTTADLGWTAGGSETAWDIELGTAGFMPTGTPTASGVTNPYTAMGLTADTIYEFYVRADCGVDGTSSWTGPFLFRTGHCLVSGTSTATYIDTFATTGTTGDDINNASSGFTAGNYADNYSTMTVRRGQDQAIDFNVEIVSGTVGCAIWVDWNNDLVFDSSEVEFSTTSYGSGPFTGSFNTPAAAANGDYRMRVMIDWNDPNPGDDDACALGSGRGEVEDYKLVIDNTLAIESAEVRGFTHYVDTVNNNFVVNAQSNIESIEVYNLVGQVIATAKPNSTAGIADLGAVKNGVYFARVTLDNKRTSIVKFAK